MASCAATGRDVMVYDYHLKPPFLLDNGATRGLDAEIIEYLNRKGGPHRYILQYLPRNRLNAMIEQGKLEGLVMGVNPVWFKDRQHTLYRWSPPYLPDRDIVISLRDRPVEYTEPASLKGLRVGFPAGFYYFGISELASAGELTREEAPTEEMNLRKLSARRIDATIVSRSTYIYLLKANPEWEGEFHVAKEAEEKFERRFLIPKAMADVQADLDKALAGLERDPEWMRILARYGLRR